MFYIAIQNTTNNFQDKGGVVLSIILAVASLMYMFL
jgi:hypothetical protein